VSWCTQKLLRGGGLDDNTAVHYLDPIADVCDYREIVTDKHQRATVLCSEILKEFKHLGLDGNVEGSRWLIGQNQVRVAGDCHSYHHPLPLSP
jgi:hypothetical protein